MAHLVTGDRSPIQAWRMRPMPHSRNESRVTEKVEGAPFLDVRYARP